MKYTSIRYLSDFKVDEIEEATKAMEKAGAFDVPGVGSWRIEPLGEHISYLFFPGMATKLALTKQEYMWMQIGRKTKDKWEEKLPGHTFKFALDTTKPPENGFKARFRKHKRDAMMIKEFFSKRDSVKDAMEKAKEMVEKVEGNN